MTFLYKYTIKQKIKLIGLSAASIILLLLAGLYIFSHYLNSNLTNMKSKELLFKDTSNDLTRLISSSHNEILISSILSNNIKNLENDLGKFEDVHDEILLKFNILENILKKKKQTVKIKNTLKILQMLQLRYNSYYNIIKNLPNDFKSSYEDGIDGLIGINSIADKMFDELELFTILATKKFNYRIDELTLNLSNILTIFIIIAILSLLIFLIFSSILKNTIMESLYNLNDGIEHFFLFLSQKQNHADDIKITYNDEFGEIAEHINDHIHEAEVLVTNERKFKEILAIEVNKQTKELRELNEDMVATQKDIINMMGTLAESRSKETGNHVKKVAIYSKLLAKKYGLDDKMCELLYIASPMHDIGKVGTADNILNKPAKFTDKEFEIMKSHAQIGYDILKGSNKEIIQTAAIISLEHHEKWNGQGYPNGKKGEDIHILGRITALADVFDALGSDRCYKLAWKDEQIFKLFKEERGEHFDPKLVDIFFDNLNEFLEIRDNYKE